MNMLSECVDRTDSPHPQAQVRNFIHNQTETYNYVTDSFIHGSPRAIHLHKLVQLVFKQIFKFDNNIYIMFTLHYINMMYGAAM